MCDFIVAGAGCPDGDFTITATDDTLAITFRGFDRADGTPTMSTKATTAGATDPFDIEWADEETVTLTYPITADYDPDARRGFRLTLHMEVEDGTTATFGIQAPD